MFPICRVTILTIVRNKITYIFKKQIYILKELKPAGASQLKNASYHNPYT